MKTLLIPGSHRLFLFCPFQWVNKSSGGGTGKRTSGPNESRATFDRLVFWVAGESKGGGAEVWRIQTKSGESSPEEEGGRVRCNRS